MLKKKKKKVKCLTRSNDINNIIRNIDIFCYNALPNRYVECQQ